MRLFKKAICIFVAIFIFALGVACAPTSSNSGNENNNGGGNGGNQTETAKISASLLDGKIANLLGARGVGAMDKSCKKTQQNNSVSPYRAVFADEVDITSDISTQKETELVKDTEDGVYDVCFHDIEGEEKTYKELNNKYPVHHHDGVECDIVDCEEISDEILEEEQNGEAKTVISLDSRVNKLYTVGNFTFMSVSSAVKGQLNVMTDKSKDLYHFGYLVEGSVFPTAVNAEWGSDGYSFSWISGLPNNGMIPIKVREDEKNYHTSNYWSDDYNQSYIIDNITGITYSLSQFKYIYSVDGGVLKVYNKNVANYFDYYKPVITGNGLTFEKYGLPDDESVLDKIAGSKVLVDIYGNMVFSNNGFGDEGVINEDGEIKIDTNKILAQKVQSVYSNLNSTNNRAAASEYLMAQRYHKGSDGRIYRVNFKGDMTNVSVNVLDENCLWQSVDQDVNVAFDADSSAGYIAWGIGERITQPAYYRITCVKEGYAFYSTAAHFDGGRVWSRAYYQNRSSMNNNGHVVGVVKISTDGSGEEVDRWSHEFYANGLPLDNPYSVILVGNTQMLYFGNNEICLRDVLTGEEKTFSFTFDARNGYYCSPEFHNNLYVVNLGYLNIEKEINFATFGRGCFSEKPVYNEIQYDAYYKLLTEK